MTTIRKGDKGSDVRTCQELLNKLGYGLVADGVFGTKTETAVKDFQKKNNLTSDGIVGPKTWAVLQKNECNCNCECCTPSIISINDYWMNSDEYVQGKSTKDFIVIHSTAGWNNPYNTIKDWNTDTRGRVATEFVIGGKKCTDGNSDYDGEVVSSFPQGYWAYHIGTAGASGMDKRSVGIETCNFGHLVNGKTYAGSVCQPQQIVTLPKKFK